MAGNQGENKTAVVLAAHGSHAEPAANALVRAHARRIERLGRFAEVAVAFQQGAPSFADVLDQLSATEITIVPMMTSNGYYAEVVLPREFSKNRRFADVQIRQTQPIGTHPLMLELVSARLCDLVREHRLSAADTAVLVVGHGTTIHAGSRRPTESLAEALRATGKFAEVSAAFLDEQPSVRQAYAALNTQSVIVIPFLIGMGKHDGVDIPQQLGLNGSNEHKLPLRRWINDRLVLCDAAVGTHPRIADIIVDLASPSEVS